MESLAIKEYERVRKLSAFHVQGAIERKRLNQHATRYCFPDGSLLYCHASRFARATDKQGRFVVIGNLFEY